MTFLKSKHYLFLVFSLLLSLNVKAQCSDLTVNTTTYSNTGLSTCGFGDDFSSSSACGSSYMGGDDFVIVYTPTTTGNIDIALTNTGSWTGVFVTDLCPNNGGATCLSSNTNSGGNPSITGLSVTAGTTYYITVSTWPSPQCTAFDINITTAAGPPVNDDCSGAIPLTVNPDLNCGTTTSGTVASATASSQSSTSCSGTEDDDVWFSFVATNTSHSIDLLNIAGSTTDMYMSLWSGSCPSLSLVSGTCSDPNSQTVSGLTIGQTYYLRVYTWTSTTGQNSTFDVCIGTPPPPPSNDDCSGAIALTVNPDYLCGSTTAGTVVSATASSQSSTSCSGTEDDDVWFSFVATGSSHSIDLMNITGSTTDMYMSVWSGTCPTLSLVSGSCSDPNSQVVTGLTVGQTYYIRVYTYTSSTGQTSAFDICVGTPPPPPSNDDCSGAISLTVNPDLTCAATTSGSVGSATASSQSSASCSGTEDDDVWYSFVATSTSHQITLSNITGSTTDMYHSVWTGTCPSLTLLAGSCSDPNSQTLTGLTIGQTYYIRVYTYTSTTGQTSSYDICVGTPVPPPACNGSLPAPNDACASATSINTFDGYCGTTLASYTVDANSAFCGSIDNNSWLQFVASETSVSITWWITGGASCSSGVQFEAYSGTCGSLTALSSSCVNPTGSTGANGIFSFSGLTIGNTYYIMIDGYAGNVCNYTWQAQSGILPIEIVNFKGVAYAKQNQLTWETKSEINNDYFIIEKSVDGKNFYPIGKIKGSGNSSTSITYNFSDLDINSRNSYYRIKQVDFDGKISYSFTITVERNEKLIYIYPNPSEGLLNFNFNNLPTGQYQIKYTNILGVTIIEEITLNSNSSSLKSDEFKRLPNGIYIITVVNNNQEIMTQEKIIKK